MGKGTDRRRRCRLDRCRGCAGGCHLFAPRIVSFAPSDPKKARGGRRTGEPVVHHRDERAADKDDDADVVQAIPALGDLCGQRRVREENIRSERMSLCTSFE